MQMTVLSSLSLFARADASDHWLAYCQQYDTPHESYSDCPDASVEVISYDNLIADDGIDSGIELLRTHTRASGKKE